MTDSRIALFPLNVVLYPGATLPLHIFEPRYKLMINHCIAHNREFGVILAGDKGVATIGCTAAITQKLKDYDDGRMDILTQGRTIFRALNLLHEKDYHEALVEFLTDSDELHAPAGQQPGRSRAPQPISRMPHADLRPAVGHLRHRIALAAFVSYGRTPAART